MRQSSLVAAFAVVLIAGFLRFPQASGLHLVSNQRTGTDNENNPPVHYVPKMASKLGLPQPQNRKPEVLTDDALATAVRQVIESHKRQSAMLDRLAALTPKLKPQESQTKTKTKLPARTQQTPTKSSESVIMRPAGKHTEKKYTPESDEKSETDTANQTLIERTTIRKAPPARIQYPNKPLHRTNSTPVPPDRHFISYFPSHPTHLPTPHYNPPGFHPHFNPHFYPPGFYPQFSGGPQTQGIITQQNPSFRIQYPYNAYPVNSQTVSPLSHDYKMQYPANPHGPDVNSSQFTYSVNTHPVSHEYSGQHATNPHVHGTNSNQYPYSVNLQPTNVVYPLFHDYRKPNLNLPDVNSQQYSYLYPRRPQGL